MNPEEFSECLKILAHPARLEIVRLLSANPDGVATSVIALNLNISVGQTCNHTRGMVAAEIITKVRVGANSIYYLNRERMVDIYNNLGDAIYGKKKS